MAKFKTVEDEIVDTTGIKKKPDQDQQSYLYDQAEAVLKDIEDKDYKALSASARKWAEGAGNAINSGKRIPPIPDDWEDEEEEEVEAAAPDEKDEETDNGDEEEEPDEEEEDDEEEEPEESDEDDDGDFVEEEEEEEAVEATPAKAKQEERAKARTEMHGVTTTEKRVPPHKVVKKIKAKAAPVKKAKTKKAKAAPVKKVKKSRGNGESKRNIIAGLLKRKSGVTTPEILKATGWPTVSVPAQAKALGLKLRKTKKKGELTTYFAS